MLDHQYRAMQGPSSGTVSCCGGVTVAASGIPVAPRILQSTILYFTPGYSSPRYSTLLQDTPVHNTLLYSIILFSRILHNTQYSTTLQDTGLTCTLYSAPLHSSSATLVKLVHLGTVLVAGPSSLETGHWTLDTTGHWTLDTVMFLLCPMRWTSLLALLYPSSTIRWGRCRAGGALGQVAHHLPPVRHLPRVGVAGGGVRLVLAHRGGVLGGGHGALHPLRGGRGRGGPQDQRRLKRS